MSTTTTKAVPVSITVKGKNGETKTLEFTQESIIVGTGGTANVKLDDADASSLHAMLKFKPDGTLVVLDLGSDSGTILNDKELEGETALQDGAELKIGNTRLTVHFGGHVADNATVPLRKPKEDKKDEKPVESTELVDRKKAKAPVDDEMTDPVRAADSESTERQPAPPPPLKKADKKEEKKEARSEGKKEEKKAAPPPKPAAAARKSESAGGLSPLAQRLLEEELPEEERPSDSNRMLEVALVWKDTVLEVRHAAVGQPVTMGTDAKCTFRMSAEGWGTEPYALVSPDGTVNAPSGAEVRVRAEGKTKAGSGGMKLGLGERAAVTVGEITFMFQWVAKAKIVPTSPWKTIDFYFQKILIGTIAAHVLLFFIFHLTPVDPDALADDLFKNPNAFAKLILKPQEKEKKKKEDLSGKKGGGKHKDKEGKFGKKEVKQKEAASSKKGAPVVDPNKREKDRAIAFNSGVLGILKNNKGAVSNVFGPGGLGTGINNALGGLNGTSMGDAGGAGGLGTRGTGPGGGGNALGIGGLGSGTGRGSGGQGDVDLGGRGKGTTKITPGKTIVEGGLSKEEIGRVIRRYLSQIKYCYEKELTRNPNLAGKIVVSFTIGGTGKVTEADVAETSLNDPTVEDCVLKIIKRIQFPQPKGGGIVLVTYPFIFQASGG
ncbi:MAG: TonB family protein [Myxococcota bacterium]